MDRQPDKLIDEVLRLPEAARAALAGILLESLEGAKDEGAEAAWAAEIDRRLANLDSGTARTIPWSLARRQILGEG